MTALAAALASARADMQTIATTLAKSAAGATGPSAFGVQAVLRSLSGAIDWAEAVEHSLTVGGGEPGE
ncbi:hypothetical protein ONA92_26635 [Mycobacteroides salmoniphilum]|uniref:hypothetical protein n=1 Tax=Mycobacteroides salmoniphilum TaxID=404941 RepID=UPI00356A97A4